MSFIFVLGIIELIMGYFDIKHHNYYMLGFDTIMAILCFGYVFVFGYIYRRKPNANL